MAERQFEDTQNISLNPTDFAEDLNSFGVQDTQNIAKTQLDSFLLSDPSTADSKSITKVETEDDNKTNTKQDKGKKPENTNTDKNDVDPIKTKDELNEEKENQLNSWLNDDKDSEDSSNDKTETKSNETTKKDDKAPIVEEDNTFNLLGKDLLRLGVFTKDDDEADINIKTPEEFLERFNLEKNKQATELIDNFLGKFGDDYKNMFDSIFVKGVDPKDYLSSYNKIETFKDLDLSKADIQEKVFFQYYRDQGLSEEKITKRFEKMKDLGDLGDEVKDMHELLLAKEEKNLIKLEQEKQAQIQQRTQRETAYQNNIGSILQAKLKVGDFDGIPVTQKEAREAYSYMTQKPYKLPNGELITEMHKDWLELDKPENHELKVKVALLLKNKMDLSKVVKKAVSKNSDSLFSDLTGKSRTARTEQKQITPTKSFFE